jgi:hypothetical protein
LEAIHKAEAVLIGIVEKPAAAEEECQDVVTTIVGGLPG